MKIVRWDHEKNAKLKQERGVSFEMVTLAMAQGNVLDDLIHPNSEKYANQRILVVKIREYAWLVPYVETELELFLKTIIPSRKATKKYLGGDI
ncbi:MAG: BrnT family toxin [Gloeobacterales cyanobacterium]